MATRLFDCIKQLDYLFGQSDGVLLFRGIGELIDARPREIRAPGGTRKIVYLSGAPGNFIHNYKLIRTGLWARIAWSRAGHGTQTVGHLLDLSRVLSDVGFLLFAVVFHDILALTLRPFALQVQSACEPAVLAHAEGRLRQQLEDTGAGIISLRTELSSPALGLPSRLPVVVIVSARLRLSGGPRKVGAVGIAPRGPGVTTATWRTGGVDGGAVPHEGIRPGRRCTIWL
jgi:hypothetical protein